MEQIKYPSEAVPLSVAARYLRVPARWLRDEIEAGELPALRAGRAVLVHVPTIAALLSARAKDKPNKGDSE
jgi:excisionase family DNA binding protein